MTPEELGAHLTETVASPTTGSGVEFSHGPFASVEAEERPTETTEEQTIEEDYSNPDKVYGAVNNAAKPKDTPVVETEEEPPARSRPGRDYSMFSEEERTWAREMSRAAYDNVVKLRQQHKELSAKLPTLEKELNELRALPSAKTVLDHDNAYKLSDEYNQIVEEQQNASAESTYLENQLALANDGKPFTALQRMVDQQGKVSYQLVPNQPPTGEGISRLLSQLTDARARYQNANTKATVYPEQFKNQRSAFVSGLNTFMQRGVTPLWESVKDAEAERIHQGLLTQIPSVYRNTPIGQALAVTLATNIVLARKLSSKSVAQTNAEADDRAARTVQTRRASGGGKHKPADIYEGVTDDDFVAHRRY